MKLKTFKSRNYIVSYDGLSGTWCIFRNKDEAKTYSYVCHEGYLEYMRLKAIYKRSRKLFDIECIKQEYHEPTLMYAA